MSGHLIRLYHLTVALPKEKVIVELGVRGGESTTALLAAVNDSGGHLYSVDVVNCSHVYHGEPNWSFFFGNDMVILKTWNQKIDHLFIDTSHTFEHTLAELRGWSSWLQPWGIITLHDTIFCPGVAKAVQQFLAENPSYAFKNYLECYGLGLLSFKNNKIGAK